MHGGEPGAHYRWVKGDGNGGNEEEVGGLSELSSEVRNLRIADEEQTVGRDSRGRWCYGAMAPLTGLLIVLLQSRKLG